MLLQMPEEGSGSFDPYKKEWNGKSRNCSRERYICTAAPDCQPFLKLACASKGLAVFSKPGNV